MRVRRCRAARRVVASSVRASPASAISSVTPCPIMWTPRTSPWRAPATTLTKPSVCPVAIALPSARNGNLPTLTSPALARLRLGEPDRRDLGLAVHAHRHARGVERACAVTPPRDRLRRDHALLRRGVRQEQRADEIADRGDAGARSSASCASTTTKPRSVRTPSASSPSSSRERACGRRRPARARAVERARLRIPAHRDARALALALEPLEAMTDEHLDPLPAERTRQLAARGRRPCRAAAVGHLDHRDLRAEARVGVRELDADAPPPITTTDAGSRASSSASRLVCTTVPSTSRPGSVRSRLPVASRTWRAREPLGRRAVARHLDAAPHEPAASLHAGRCWCFGTGTRRPAPAAPPPRGCARSRGRSRAAGRRRRCPRPRRRAASR